VLDGDPKTSSGKSVIYEAYPHDGNGQPSGEAVVVKLSENTEALQRERENFGRIANCEKSKPLFVQVHDYVEHDDPSNDELNGQGALIMERGEQDLRSYVRKNGPLQGQELRDAAKAAAKVVRAVHNSDMVWTEIKAANFVVKENQENEKAFAFDLKGIDLESAVPHKDNPIDYSPEACPPEFAVAFLCGREPFMEMDYSFDIWSLGMVFYKLSAGTGYFDPDKIDKVDIANTLKNGDGIDLNNVQDPLMKDLIEQCLAYDAASRPNIDEILEHAFFQS
jgi:serine/threonine protein kinase